jgi:FkbM family methyltransferase
MRSFNGVEGWVRRHFLVYRIIRSSAPFLCKYLTLEEGFDFLKYVQPQSTDLVVLDIGANDGTSIRMIRQFHKNSKIVAFDPITKPKFDLRNIDFREYALSNSEKSFSLFTPIVHGVALSQYSSFHVTKLRTQIEHDLGVRTSDYGIVEKTVESRTLDSLNLAPYFLKLDVEGSEVEVLKGALNTIKNHLPVILVEIQSAESFSLISQILTSSGYVSISLTPSSNLTISDVKGNYQTEYVRNRNNYVWITKEPSPSWRFLK